MSLMVNWFSDSLVVEWDVALPETTVTSSSSVVVIFVVFLLFLLILFCLLDGVMLVQNFVIPWFRGMCRICVELVLV